MTRLKFRRLQLEFTQYHIEKLTGISQPRLSLLERDFREPSCEEKEKLAKILKAKVQELFQ